MKKNVSRNGSATIDKKSPAYAIKQYNMARSALMTALIFTVVNLVLYLIGSNTYFILSIYFTYWMFGADLISTVLSLAVFGAFVLFYAGSKKKTGFIVAGLVGAILDTLFLFLLSFGLMLDPELNLTIGDFAVDYVAHIVLIVLVAIGCGFAKRYRAAITENPERVSGSPFGFADDSEENVPEETVAPAESENTEETVPSDSWEDR